MFEDLTPEQIHKQIQELRIALMAAFPQPQVLALMVQDELKMNLDEITSGEPNYELAANKLVQWANAQGKVQELLEGARKKNPGNPKLEEFSKSYSRSQDIKRKTKRIKELKKILSEEYEELKEEIKLAYRQAVCFRPLPIPGEVPDCLDTLIRNLNGDSKYSEFDTLDFFVGYLLLPGQESLNKLSYELINHLQAWQTECTKESSKLEIKIQEKLEEDKKKQPCLLIRISTSSKDNYYVNIYSIEDWKSYREDRDRSIGVEQILTSNESYPESKIQKIVCSKIKEFRLKLKKSFPIHIFLPVKLMKININEWPGGPRDKPLGLEYEILLHSDDRFSKQEDYEYEGDWIDKWKIFEDLDSLDGKSSIFEDVELESRYAFDVDDSKIGARICCPLLAFKDIDDLFDELVYGSPIPIALWAEKSENLDLRGEIEKILSGHPSQLSLKIKERRLNEKNVQNHVVHSLSLLWDDPCFPPPTSTQTFLGDNTDGES